MLMNQDLATHLARDHQRQMLAEASRQRQYQDRPAPRTPSAATRVIRGLAAAITRPAGSRPRPRIRRSRAA